MSLIHHFINKMISSCKMCMKPCLIKFQHWNELNGQTDLQLRKQQVNNIYNIIFMITNVQSHSGSQLWTHTYQHSSVLNWKIKIPCRAHIDTLNDYKTYEHFESPKSRNVLLFPYEYFIFAKKKKLTSKQQ